MPHKDPEVRKAYAREYMMRRRRAQGVQPKKVGVDFDRKAYYEANRERLRAGARERYYRDHEASKERSREYARANPGAVRARRLRREYGITPEDVEAMREAQGGRCAICETETTLVVDHDHETGAVRGLLCNACNSALGYFRDDPGLMEAAKRYLGVEMRRWTILPEVKTGEQIPASFDKFVGSEWFRRALSQSARAVPVGSGALACVVIRGDFAVVDIRGGLRG